MSLFASLPYVSGSLQLKNHIMNWQFGRKRPQSQFWGILLSPKGKGLFCCLNYLQWEKASLMSVAGIWHFPAFHEVLKTLASWNVKTALHVSKIILQRKKLCAWESKCSMCWRLQPAVQITPWREIWIVAVSVSDLAPLSGQPDPHRQGSLSHWSSTRCKAAQGCRRHLHHPCTGSCFSRCSRAACPEKYLLSLYNGEIWGV